ncbi:MAG: parallel beta-helix domain-containing protein [Candidatus Hydrogenedentota bacterium]
MKMTLSAALACLLAFGAQAVTIIPGANIQETVQEALILAEEGDVIEFAAGTYEFTMGLSLDVDNVTIRGAGHDKTILSFKNQDAGSEGLMITSSGVALEDFAVEDTVGDAIKIKGAKGITCLRVRTEWTRGPHETNGAYGFYPVASSDVLIDGCIVKGASDAGVYVGQSTNIIVRNCLVQYNVAGIEIENCYYADVYDNETSHNTGGILVFDMPNLPQMRGHHVRIFNNKVINNDTKNFAPEGNIVGLVPTGTGLMVMANEYVEVFGNHFDGNGTANVIIRAFYQNTKKKVDATMNVYPEAIYVHDNTFGTGGFKPMGMRGEMYTDAAGRDTLPDIVWDGMVNPGKAVNGKLPKELGIYLKNNGDADYINLDLTPWWNDKNSNKPTSDIKELAGELPALPAISIPGDRESTD